VAIEVSTTDQPYWQTAEKRPLGFVAASVAQPVALAEPAGMIQVEAVSAPTAEAGAPH
jgi:hypothetical protein